MWEFFQKFGEGLRGLPTSNIGGRKLWGNFSRNLGTVCVGCQKQYWREETVGEFFSKLGEIVCLDFQKQYWREETMGEFF